MRVGGTLGGINVTNVLMTPINKTAASAGDSKDYRVLIRVGTDSDLVPNKCFFDSLLNRHKSVAAKDENTKQVFWRYAQIFAPYSDLHASRSLLGGDPRDSWWWTHLI